MDRLTQFARVITFDRRGSGLSDPLHGAPTLEEQIDDVLAVMDAAGSTKAAICATLEGGPMAVAVRRHPPRPHPGPRPLRHLLQGHLGRGLPMGVACGGPRRQDGYEHRALGRGLRGRERGSQPDGRSAVPRMGGPPGAPRRQPGHDQADLRPDREVRRARRAPLDQGAHARDAPPRGQLHKGRALPLHRRARARRALRGAGGDGQHVRRRRLRVDHRRDRGVPHRRAARERARPHAGHGDVHRHRGLHPARRRPRATATGRTCWGATTSSSAALWTAIAAARSSTRATASWPPSTARRARSAARRRSPTPWRSWGWSSGPDSTPASSR